MAYFPNKTKVKTELRESTSENDLSCVHLTTANFFELNVGYYRENTPREYFKLNAGVFARPVPMQAPVMGEAVLKMKYYYVPYRTCSPQWNDFITRAPHVPYNGTTPIRVAEMPYTMATDLIEMIQSQGNSTAGTAIDNDFITDGGEFIKLTQKGRHKVKILNQLGYQIVMDSKSTQHFDMMPLLALAKVYIDYYTTNQYSNALFDTYQVEALLKKDEATAYRLTANDLNNILDLTSNVMYAPDYFTSQWDNPVAPNEVATSMGNITLQDITTANDISIYTNNSTYSGTPLMENNAQTTAFSQYAIDSLKKLTDYVKRMQISTKAIDRYLARFGVLLTNEKMQRSQYEGEQITNMNFGAIYSTAETEGANLGDYAGQGIINSDGQEHKVCEFEELNEFGCILGLFSINPKIGYYQGIDRQHLLRDVESYFNGEFDSLGTQATSAAELYVSKDGRSIYGKQRQIDAIFGYLPRYAHLKVGKDRLTGDFVRTTINAGAEAWHMFRVIDESQYNTTENNMVHSPSFVNTKEDANQYNRIFNYTAGDAGDMFNIILKFAVQARLHAKPLYDDYDFESEGKQIIMDGQGAKQN